MGTPERVTRGTRERLKPQKDASKTPARKRHPESRGVGIPKRAQNVGAVGTNTTSLSSPVNSLCSESYTVNAARATTPTKGSFLRRKREIGHPESVRSHEKTSQNMQNDRKGKEKLFWERPDRFLKIWQNEKAPEQTASVQREPTVRGSNGRRP